MKKLFFSIVAFLFVITANAQNDVTKFMGIPVDGTKEEVLAKLRDKGFKTSVLGDDYLEGVFNGSEVFVCPLTNGNKVWRIAVIQQTEFDETQIKIRFNILYSQFLKNSKYTALKDQRIPENENISHQIAIYKKQYQANFYQDNDTKKSVWFTISEGQSYNKYILIIFYDNEYNQANGEDL